MADSTIKVNVVPELSGVKIEGLEELNKKLDFVISLLKPPPFKAGGFINKPAEVKRPDTPEVMQMKTEIMVSLIQAHGEMVRASDLTAEAERIYKAVGLNP